MPSLIILATADNALAAVWEKQIQGDRSVLHLADQSFPGGTQSGFAAVVVLDALCQQTLPSALSHCPTIYVGEPKSLPYEQARLQNRAKVYLSYDESNTRLGDYLEIVEELAEKESMVELLLEKHRRQEVVDPAPRGVSMDDAAEWWDFLEGAVESFDTRDRLIAEFRRASRHLLHASHTVFFLREADGFHADRGTSFLSSSDPLVEFLEYHPVVIDGLRWNHEADPVAELAVRNHLAMWGARLLVPIHDNGKLLGLIALGVRDDGQPYEEQDRSRSVFFARLLRQFLARSEQLGRLTRLADQVSRGAKYLPNTLVLDANEDVPRQVPLIVRDMIGRVRRQREVQRFWPQADQPFRGSAGLMRDNSGVWAYWEEASAEVHDAADRQREERRIVLHELGLTLSHELGNALVSLATFRQMSGNQPAPEMLDSLKTDIQKLEDLNKRLEMLQNLDEVESAPVDIRTVVQEVGEKCGIEVAIGPDEVELTVAESLLRFALNALVETMTENYPSEGGQDIALQLRSTGEGEDRRALISLKGSHLELEGILPEPEKNAVPNQGRMAVFLAKEIIRIHQGDIHAGPGLEGTEILISIRSC